MSAVLIAGTESGWYRGNVDALVPDGIEGVFLHGLVRRVNEHRR